MRYLDFERLEALDPAAYLAADPYPWVNPEGILFDDAHAALVATLPGLSLFERVFGKTRKHGQKSHDRYGLEYRPALELSEAWRGFMAELRGDRYRAAIARLVGVPSVHLSFHWHYAPNGCSVSPHCDARRKLGSHIFYLNTESDWDPSWGGETLVLDDGGRFQRDSAPEFEDFDRCVSSQALGNWSLIFTRAGNSWHGVREVRCPEGRMRKVFIVVINRDDRLTRMQRWLRPAMGGY